MIMELVVVARLLGVVGKHHRCAARATMREMAVFDLVLGRAVFRVGVVGIQKQNRTGQHVHDVRRGVAS